MVRLLKSFLRVSVLGTVILLLNSCDSKDILYKSEYTAEEKLALSESLLNGAGTDLYYQGTVGERMIIHEGNRYNPNNAWGQRELGVPYLKRGFAHEANKYYELAIADDPQEWLGYKAYCWLYFYRDYETALAEIDRYDAFTPDFVDYPQSTSVNYMRGICYLKLDKYDEAIKYLDLHIAKDEKDVGPEYVDAMPYLLLGMAHHKNGNYKKANAAYSRGIKYNDTTSDLYYYKAKNLLAMDDLAGARKAFRLAQDWYSKGAKNTRPYVTEFYAIFQEDLDALRKDLNS